MEFLNSATSNEPLEYAKPDQEEVVSPPKPEFTKRNSSNLNSEISRKIGENKSPAIENIEDEKIINASQKLPLGKRASKDQSVKKLPLPLTDRQKQTTGRTTDPTQDTSTRNLRIKIKKE